MVQALKSVLGLEKRCLNVQVPGSVVPCAVHHYQSCVCFILDGYGWYDSYCWEDLLLAIHMLANITALDNYTFHTCLKHCSQGRQYLAFLNCVASLICPHSECYHYILVMQTISLYTVIAQCDGSCISLFPTLIIGHCTLFCCGYVLLHVHVGEWKPATNEAVLRRNW